MCHAKNQLGKENDGGFWLASGPNGQGWTQIIKEITCYTQ